jgi:hypothetical protein
MRSLIYSADQTEQQIPLYQSRFRRPSELSPLPNTKFEIHNRPYCAKQNFEAKLRYSIAQTKSKWRAYIALKPETNPSHIQARNIKSQTFQLPIAPTRSQGYAYFPVKSKISFPTFPALSLLNLGNLVSNARFYDNNGIQSFLCPSFLLSLPSFSLLASPPHH